MLQTILGMLAGAGLGFLYFRFIGCKTGHCAITSSRTGSIMYGGLLGALLINTFTFAQSGHGIQQADNQLFMQKMKEKQVVILDVRTPMEFRSGHIPGALLMDVNNQQFDAQISKLDSNKTYLVYCRSGVRSMNAARKMQAVGLKVINLQGGIMGWNGPLKQ